MKETHDVQIKVCKTCKKIFQTMTGTVLCQECRKELEEQFKKAKEYIRKNPGAGVQEVSDTLKIQPKQILKWVREDRLFFADHLKVRVPCLACGEMIGSGRYCRKCEAVFGEGSMGAVAKSPMNKEPVKKSPAKSKKGKSDYISID